MTNRQRIWTAALTVALTASVILVGASVAYGQEVTAQGMTVEIPIETVHKGDPGDLFHEGTFDADPGEVCIAELTFDNDPGEEPSIHLGNDILVGPVVFPNVENGTFEAAGLSFIATGSNDVAVRLGDDGVFSGGFALEVTCNPPTTTTTITAPTSPSTTTTTDAPSSPSTTAPPVTPTTLSPPPVGGIDTGYGSCADGACDGSLSPLTTWLLISGILVAGSGLVWVYFRYTFGDTG